MRLGAPFDPGVIDDKAKSTKEGYDYERSRQRNRATADIFAIGVWENEAAHRVAKCLDKQYGRHIEADRSWTVYHVFTGVPAHTDRQIMADLSRLDATDACCLSTIAMTDVSKTGAISLRRPDSRNLQ